MFAPNLYQIMYCLAKDVIINKMKTLNNKDDYIEWFEILDNEIKTYNYNQTIEIDSDPEEESKIFTIMVIVHKLLGNMSHGKIHIVESERYIEFNDAKVLLSKRIVEMHDNLVGSLLPEPSESIIQFLEEYDDVIDYINTVLSWN